MRNFVLISVLMWCAMVVNATDCDYLMHAQPDSLTRYRVQLQARNATLDGVLAVKIVDGNINGVVINDFGIKAFAFIISHDRKKVKLQDVMPMLNHWYVKRVLKSDLKLLFNITDCDKQPKGKKTQIEILDDGSIKMTNTKYHIEYLFTKAQVIETQESGREGEEIELEYEITE